MAGLRIQQDKRFDSGPEQTSLHITRSDFRRLVPASRPTAECDGKEAERLCILQRRLEVDVQVQLRSHVIDNIQLERRMTGQACRDSHCWYSGRVL